MRGCTVREGCQRGTCPPSEWWLSRMRKTAKRLPSKQLLGISIVMVGGAAGLYTCQIHLAAHFENHPLLKSPLLLLCINDFSAVQYWSTALFMLTWVRWVMESIIRIWWVSSPFPEFQYYSGFTVNSMIRCIKLQYPLQIHSSVENPPKMWSTFSAKVFL